MKRLLDLATLGALWAALLPSSHHLAAGEDKAPGAASAPATEVIEVDPVAASEILKSANPPTILDVRTPEEFAGERLPRAVNIDFNANDFSDRLAKLDRAKPYLIHCASGGRSFEALPIFRKLGFRKIYHLHEGANGWIAAGLPAEK
jgi:rhodanese-related sulfurtransferase